MKEFDVYLKVQMKHGALQEFILERGWTQSDFAKAIGMPAVEVGKWFNLRNWPRTIEAMSKVCSLLEKTPEEIFPQMLRGEGLRGGKRNFWVKQKVPLNMISYNEAKALPAPEDMEQQFDIKEAIRKVIGKLNPLERKILKLRFGIGGDAEYSLAEIGEVVGLSSVRVQQIEAKALRKLRHPSKFRYISIFEEVKKPKKGGTDDDETGERSCQGGNGGHYGGEEKEGDV